MRKQFLFIGIRSRQRKLLLAHERHKRVPPWSTSLMTVSCWTMLSELSNKLDTGTKSLVYKNSSRLQFNDSRVHASRNISRGGNAIYHSIKVQLVVTYPSMVLKLVNLDHVKQLSPYLRLSAAARANLRFDIFQSRKIYQKTRHERGEITSRISKCYNKSSDLNVITFKS